MRPVILMRLIHVAMRFARSWQRRRAAGE